MYSSDWCVCVCQLFSLSDVRKEKGKMKVRSQKIAILKEKIDEMKMKEKKKIYLHPKYTHKEERRRILTMSFKKLSKISNPESILNKAVLINNMLRNIQNQIVFEASVVKHHSCHGPADLHVLQSSLSLVK